jgi:predicted methyltransferase
MGIRFRSSKNIYRSRSPTMRVYRRVILAALLAALVAYPAATCFADSGDSTRITKDDQQARTITGGYPYREKSDYVLGELDLKPGDVVVDIGAGDGWWSEKMAPAVGPTGAVHAAEVGQDKVDKMKKSFADTPQIKPYLIPLDGTALEENSCDLAFFSKAYHHLNKDSHVDYLRHLNEVVKPTGRLVVIEQYQKLAVGKSRDHAWAPGLLIQQAEEADWVLLRCELIAGTHHFIAVFAQNEIFPVKQPEKKPEKKPAMVESK